MDKPEPGAEGGGGEEEEEGDEEEEQAEEVMEERVAEMTADDIKKVVEQKLEEQQHRDWLKTLRHKRIILRYVHPQPIYLLFNPWHQSMWSTLCYLLTFIAPSRK